jgi:glucokinase
LNALAIDLGGSHATCAVVRDESVLISSIVRADGHGNLLSVLPAIRDELRRLTQAVEISVPSCEGLAFGFCGIVDSRAKRVLSTSKKFDDAVNLDLASWCRSCFGLPFAIENDARMALLGEVAFGAAKGACDAVMITLGSGIGGAAVIDGKLLNSKHGQAGTLGGHMPVVLGGRLCGCGNLGCAEAEASTCFLAEIYASHPDGAAGSLVGQSKLDFAQLFAAADHGDKVARATLDHCIHVWSALSVALIHAYDPEVLIVGGAVAKRAEDFLPTMQAYVQKYAWTPWGQVQLRRGGLGDQAALLGAIPLLRANR